MNGKIINHSTVVPFVLRLSKDERRVFQQNHYPSQSCIRYNSQAKEYTVSMEGFALREASAAEPIRVER